MLKKLVSLVMTGLNAVSCIAPTLTRLVIGQAFISTGWGKLHSLEKVTGFFTSLGIPAPGLNAMFIATLEFIGGILLVIGLATRPIAALLGCTMLVALLTADKADFITAFNGVFGAGDKGLTDVTPLVYGIFLAWLLLYGPGLLSLDALVKWIMEKKGWLDPIAITPEKTGESK